MYTITLVGIKSMLDRKEILNRISVLMEEKGISTYKLKESTDVSTTISQWRKNPTREKNRIPSLRSIEKICEFFDISLSYFFAFDPTEQNEIRVTELTKNIAKLDSEQIKIVEDVVREFLKHSEKNHNQ